MSSSTPPPGQWAAVDVSPWFSLSGVLGLAAVCASAVTTYSESGLACGSLLRPGVAGDLTGDSGACRPYDDARRWLVAVLLTLAAAALLAGLGLLSRSGRLGRQPVSGPRPRTHPLWTAPMALVGVVVVYAVLLLPIAFTLVTVDPGVDRGLPEAWQHLLFLVAVVVAARLACRATGLTPETGLAAAAVAAPAGLLLNALLAPSVSDRYLVPPFLTDDLAVLLLAGVPLALLLPWAARRQAAGRAAPGTTTSTELVLLTGVLSSFVLLPHLRPGYEPPAPGGPPLEHLPTTVVVLAFTAAAITAALAVLRAGRRARARPPR